jgi:hypothetical protein
VRVNVIFRISLKQGFFMNEKQEKKARDALAIAFERVGRQTVADACNVAVQTTYKWDICPAHHVLAVQEIAGVPAAWLRPDLYPG